MRDEIKPRPFDLRDPAEIRRLLLECEGYLRTCKRNHHGTDFMGRDFAMDGLKELAKRYAVAPAQRQGEAQ